MDKSQGRFVEVKHLGMVSSEADADMLKMEATSLVCKISGQLEIYFDDSKGCEPEETKCTIGNMDSVQINGTQLLLSLVYDSIGFNRIPYENYAS